MIDKTNENEMHEFIVNLYLDIKIRTNDELANLTEEQFRSEKEEMLKENPITILKNIRATVEYIMNMNEGSKSRSGSVSTISNSKINLSNNNLQNSQNLQNLQTNPYEEMLQKLEEEIRNHIRVEQQQKIQFESAVLRIEELENEKKKLKQKIQILVLKLKNEEDTNKENIRSLTKINEKLQEKLEQIDNLEKKIKCYESSSEKNINNLTSRIEKFPEKGHPDVPIVPDLPDPLYININKNKNIYINKNKNKMKDQEITQERTQEKTQGQIKTDKQSNNELTILTNKFKNLLQKFNVPIGIVGRDQNVFQFFEKSPKINSHSNTSFSIDDLKKQIDNKVQEVEKFYQNLFQIRKELNCFRLGKFTLPKSFSKNISRNSHKSNSLSNKIKSFSHITKQ